MVVAVIGFLIYSLHTGKDQIAFETLKAIILIASGGFGGYAIGTRKSQGKKPGSSRSLNFLPDAALVGIFVYNFHAKVADTYAKERGNLRGNIFQRYFISYLYTTTSTV